MDLLRSLMVVVLVAPASGCSVLLPLGEGGEGADVTAPIEGSVVSDGPVSDGPGTPPEAGAPDGTLLEAGAPDGPVDCLAACAGTWCQLPLPGGALIQINDMAGPDTANLWAVGQANKVLRFERATCSWIEVKQTLFPTTSWHTVWADASTAYVGGDLGEVLRWDGQWHSERQPDGKAVYAIASDGAGAMFATHDVDGWNGEVLKRNGSFWPIAHSTPSSPWALSVGPSVLFVAGVKGLLLEGARDVVTEGTPTDHVCAQNLDLAGVSFDALWSTGVPTASAGYALVAVGTLFSGSVPVGFVLQHSTGGMCQETSGVPLSAHPWRDIHGTSSTDLWLVGDQGQIGHIGASGSLAASLIGVPSSTGDYRAVWVGPDHLAKAGATKLIVVAGGNASWVRVLLP